MDTSVFTSALEKKILSLYARFVSLGEIEGSTTLQWVFGATIFSYFIAFNSWVNSSVTTVDSVINGTHVCWPHFPSCGDLVFLRALPEGYSQTFLYMVFFGLFLLSIYNIYKGRWVFAHLALVPAWFWHAFVGFFVSGAAFGNYDYYLFAFATILLFFPHKEYFLKLVLVMFYFLSTIAKIHPAWVLGTYFSALKTGLPLFPDWSIPIWTNLVIFMEMVASWFLLSRNTWLQRTVLAFFVTFHLYSGLLVEYRYPATVLPTLLILFGPMYRYQRPPFDVRSCVGWLLVITMFFLHISPRLIPGDEKLTMEGNKFGLYMFESNHQCVSTATVYLEDGSMRETRSESTSARSRCDVYRSWFILHTYCQRYQNISRIEWTFDHSINGGPFLRIVDEPDACALMYQPFQHNDWIRIDHPQVVGYPVENLYY